MLAVVVTLLSITHQISKPNHLLALPPGADTQILQAAHTRALAKLLQGGILVRSISKLKRDTEWKDVWKVCTSLRQLGGRTGGGIHLH